MARKTTSEIENEINQAKSWDDLKKIVKENYLGSQTFGMRLEQLCEIHHIGIQKLQMYLGKEQAQIGISDKFPAEYSGSVVTRIYIEVIAVK